MCIQGPLSGRGVQSRAKGDCAQGIGIAIGPDWETWRFVCRVMAGRGPSTLGKEGQEGAENPKPKEPTRISNLRRRLQRIQMTKQKIKEVPCPPNPRYFLPLVIFCRHDLWPPVPIAIPNGVLVCPIISWSDTCTSPCCWPPSVSK